MSVRPARWLGVVAALALAFTASAGRVWAGDPKVPPGQDPGGVAVAIIGDGLDYRRDGVASRLARDGEGELIGWDFADEDRTPFASRARAEAIAAIVIAGSDARLVLVRVVSGVEQQVAQALRLLGETPAQVALLVAEAATPIARRNLAMAARQLPRMLIVVPTRLVAPEPQGASATEDAAGLLIVSAGTHSQGSDLVVEAGSGAGAAGARAAGDAHPDDVAAASVAALAARLIAREAAPTGHTLRARILAEARPGDVRVILDIEQLPR